jgi:hypothetical protein
MKSVSEMQGVTAVLQRNVSQLPISKFLTVPETFATTGLFICLTTAENDRKLSNVRKTDNHCDYLQFLHFV